MLFVHVDNTSDLAKIIASRYIAALGCQMGHRFDNSGDAQFVVSPLRGGLQLFYGQPCYFGRLSSRAYTILNLTLSLTLEA